MENTLRLDKENAYLNMPLNITSSSNIKVDYFINDRFVKTIDIPEGTTCLLNSFSEAGIHSFHYDGKVEKVIVENAICLGSSTIERRYIFDEDDLIFIQRADRLEIFDILTRQYIYSQINLHPERITRVCKNTYQFTSRNKYVSFFSVDMLKCIHEIIADNLIFDSKDLLIYQSQESIHVYDKLKLKNTISIRFNSETFTAWVHKNTLISFNDQNIILLNLLNEEKCIISIEDIVCISEDGAIIKNSNNEFWYHDACNTSDINFTKLNIPEPDSDEICFFGKYSTDRNNGRDLFDEFKTIKECNRTDESIEYKKTELSFRNITKCDSIVYYQKDTIEKRWLQKFNNGEIKERHQWNHNNNLHLLEATIYNFDERQHIILNNGDCLYYKRGYEPKEPNSMLMIKSDGLYHQHGNQRIKLSNNPDDIISFKDDNCIRITSEDEIKDIIYDKEKNYVGCFKDYYYVGKGYEKLYLSRHEPSSIYLGKYRFNSAIIATCSKYGMSYSQFLNKIYNVDSVKFFKEGELLEIDGNQKLVFKNKSYNVPEGNVEEISSNAKYIMLENDGVTKLYNLEQQKEEYYVENKEYYDFAEMSPSGRYLMFRKNQQYYLRDLETDREELFETDRFIEFSSDDNLIYKGKDNKTYRAALIHNLDSIQTVNCQRYVYYTFQSPDHKLFGLTSKERRHRNLITNEVITNDEYCELKKKYSFSQYFTEGEQESALIYKNRQELYNLNKEYFKNKYPKLDPENIDIEHFVEDFDVVFIGMCSNPKNLLEIEISPISFLNYIAFSYDNRFVGIVGKPGTRGYIHLAQINYNETSGTLTLEKEEFTKIDDINLATWFCSFNKQGTFAAYDSTPITYVFKSGEKDPIKRDGRSLLCMSKSGKYIALSTQWYDPITLGGSGHQPSTFVEIVSGDDITLIKESFNCAVGIEKHSYNDIYKKNLVMAAFTNDDKKLMILRKDHVIIIKFIE